MKILVNTVDKIEVDIPNMYILPNRTIDLDKLNEHINDLPHNLAKDINFWYEELVWYNVSIEKKLQTHYSVQNSIKNEVKDNKESWEDRIIRKAHIHPSEERDFREKLRNIHPTDQRNYEERYHGY